MEHLDHKYISGLVPRAQTGDRNAFAELYAATYQQQYRFSLCYLKDKSAAIESLRQTYSLVFKSLSVLQNPSLFTAWLSQIHFRTCLKLQAASQPEPGPEEVPIVINTRTYRMEQLLKLPFTEAQVLILRYCRNMQIVEISRLLDMSRNSVHRYLSSGSRRLNGMLHQTR